GKDRETGCEKERTWLAGPEVTRMNSPQIPAPCHKCWEPVRVRDRRRAGDIDDDRLPVIQIGHTLERGPSYESAAVREDGQRLIDAHGIHAHRKWADNARRLRIV